jgi:hypothetical protein
MHDLFVKIHERKHPPHASSYVHLFSAFAQEWNNFILSARSGMFDGYPSSKAYPIPEPEIAVSGYVKRPVFEERLTRALSINSDIVVLGHEGSGKTTLVHYVIGHLLYANNNMSPIFLYLDTKSLDFPDDILGKQLFSLIYTRLCGISLSSNESFQSIISGDYIKWRASHPAFEPLLNVDPEINQLGAMIAYLSAFEPNRYIYLAIDNGDSLSPKALRKLIQYVEVVRTASTTFLQLAKSSASTKLRFLLPCRTSTWIYLTNATIGHIPFQNPETVLFDEKIHSVWELTKEFIMARKHDKSVSKTPSRAYVDLLRVTVPVADRSTLSWHEHSDDVILGIISWIQEHCPTAEKIISSFAGHSLRRQKMYALKVLGHDAVMQSWARTEFAKRYPDIKGKDYAAIYSADAVSNIVKEALFDAMQPFGDGMVATEILLNPFGAVTDRALRLKNPFVGINLIRLLHERWHELHTTSLMSDQVAITPVVAELKSIGYADSAICQAIESFCLAGVLRPIKSDDHILFGDRKRELQTVVPEYVVDKEAFDLYYRLVYRTGIGGPEDVASKENAILFMNACTRANYDVGYASRFESPIYKAYVNIVFLHDTHVGDAKLTRLVQESRYSGSLPAYVPKVFDSLKKKWLAVLGSVSPRKGKLENEMLQKAHQTLNELINDERNGRMKDMLVKKAY